MTHRNIIIVDDNPANLKLLEDMLQERGHEVRSFPLGRLALAAAMNDGAQNFGRDHIDHRANREHEAGSSPHADIIATPIAPGTIDLLVRSEKLTGATYKLRWPDSEHAMYVTINDIEQDGIRRPFEIFVNSKNLEHYAWVVALTRMISAVFRRGGEVAFVAEELKQVFDPRGGQWSNGRYVGSLVAAIGDIIERHLIETGFLVSAEMLTAKVAVHASTGSSATPLGPLCPKCSQPGLAREAGCLSCVHCGWSKCG